MPRFQLHKSPSSLRALGGVVFISGLLALGGCDGDDGAPGPAGPPGPPAGGALSKTLGPRDDAPGVHVQVVGLSGGSGSNGNFQVGDQIRVRYTLTRNTGAAWPLSELDRGRILVSGPTFNYQRVIAEKSDLLTRSTVNSDGSFTYVFADPIPATYLAPYNDTPSFGLDDGELQGQPLLSGTYTVGIYATWDYTVGSRSHRDQGDHVGHFLFGQATTIQPRAVVGQENCNACHVELQAHGGMRRSVDLCVLCHTAGAEDRNIPSAAGGTPGASIAMDVMIHKIHTGASLPSVLGVTTKPDGTRDYTASPTPYQLVGFGGAVHDYSDVVFPYWPNLTMPMPRDAGYTALSAQDRAKEDKMRSGAASCFACHGDPDGVGPIEAPEQGHLAYSQPSRSSCGSCHEDWVWEHPYQSNSMAMPPQMNDAACTLCHAASGNGLAVMDAHRHPVLDPTFNPGLVFEILSLAEAGNHDADGTIDPGEKVQVSFTIRDDSGASVAPAQLAGISTTISGPTSNYNMIQFLNLPVAFLSGAQPFVVNVPESITFEFVGNATGGADVFQTARAPHYTAGFSTAVLSAQLSGASTTLATAVGVRRNYLDVVDATGFARNDYLVLDRGVPGLEEYLRIQYVEQNVSGSVDRLWFGSPAQTDYPLGPRRAHAAGASVQRVVVSALSAGVHYTLDGATGTLTETGGFVTGHAILVSYTTDFVMPEVYELALNDSPDLGTASGKWSGLPILDGTYTFSIWGSRTLNYTAFGETTAYRNASHAAVRDFLVGDAAVIQPYTSIVSADSCYSCHQDMYFHGNQRRGFDTCVSCHGTAGAEDRPQYRAPGAPATTGTSIDFISMIHKIHQGGNLTNASSYEVVGFGGGAYPNNFTAHSYEHVFFPALPGGTQHCASCHGATNDAWKLPSEPLHPMASMPTRNWSNACGSCHDSNAALAHMEVMTAPISGFESCATCHGLTDDLSVPVVHKTR
jgi:hypothetical protein